MLYKSTVIFWCASLFGLLGCYSQNRISGKVFNTQNEPVEFATIELLKASDSTFVKASVSDASGNYNILNIPKGFYKIRIQHLAYTTLISDSFNLDVKTNITRNFALEASHATLETVTITSKKQLFEQKSDRMVVNITNSITQGNSLVEILQKTPTILYNPQSEMLAIQGKTNVEIYIDGRPQYLEQNALMDMLKSLSPESISKIEVFSTPPARYEASGDAGVINIVTKSKLKQDVLTVNSFLEQGSSLRYGSGINYNINNDNLSFYTNYNYANRRHLRFVRLDRAIQFEGDDIYLKQIAERRTTPKFHTIQIGAEYQLNNQTTIGTHLKYFDQSQGLHLADTTTIFLNEVRDSIISLENRDKRIPKRFLLNTTIKHNFNNEKGHISLDLDYANTKIDQTSNFSNTLLSLNNFPSANHKLFNTQDSDLQIYAIRANYAQKFNDSLNFEAGLSYSYTPFTYTNTFLRAENNVLISDETFSSKLNFKEYISAIYTSFSFKLFTFDAQLGLRLEHTKASSITEIEARNFDYTNLFPTVYISKKLKDRHQFNFNYGIRIDRPNYIDLSPYRRIINFYTEIAGNPSVKPQYTQNFNLHYTYLPKKIVFGINYSVAKDYLTYLPSQDDETRVELVQRNNLDERRITSITINKPLKLLSNSNGQINVNVLNTAYFGNQVDSSQPNNRWSYNINVNQSLNIFDFATTDLTLEYHSKALYGFIVGESRWQLNLGFSKSFFNDKATLQIGMDDIFNQNFFIGRQIYNNINAFYDNRWESQMFKLGFRYRFGEKALNPLKPKQSNIDKAQNRL